MKGLIRGQGSFDFFLAWEEPLRLIGNPQENTHPKSETGAAGKSNTSCGQAYFEHDFMGDGSHG